MSGKNRVAVAACAGLALLLTTAPRSSPAAGGPDGLGVRTAAQAVPLPQAGEIEQGLFQALNRERVSRGLPALRRSAALDEIARTHSRDQAGSGLLDHESSAGRSYSDRLAAAGILFAANGENVARGDSFDPELIHAALMKSGGHRDNILNPDFDEVGLGIVLRSDGVYYVTQDFIRAVVVRTEEEARAVVLAGLERARRSRGERPLAIDDDVQKAAQTMARARSEGRSAPAISPEFGESRALYYDGPDLERIVGLIVEVPLGRFTVAGIGVLFTRSAGQPAGSYHVCALFVAGAAARERSREEMVGAVLMTVNGLRSARGRPPLALVDALTREADELNRRYQRGRSGLRLRNPDVVATFYETPDPGRLPDELYGRVSEAAFQRIGISVLAGKSGPAGATGFNVALLLGR
jgi:uncharacterized protein YkwD